MTYLHLHDQCTSLGLDRALNGFNGAFEAVDRNKLQVRTGVHVSASELVFIHQHRFLTLSVAFVLNTYSGGATSLALIGTVSLLSLSPALSAFLIASIPAGV